MFIKTHMILDETERITATKELLVFLYNHYMFFSSLFWNSNLDGDVKPNIAAFLRLLSK